MKICPIRTSQLHFENILLHPTCPILPRNDQGRIQDLKLGVAQTDWKILKTEGGGGGGVLYK